MANKKIIVRGKWDSIIIKDPFYTVKIEGDIINESCKCKSKQFFGILLGDGETSSLQCGECGHKWTAKL